MKVKVKKNIATLFGLFLSFGLFAQSEVTTYFENGNPKMEVYKVGGRSVQTTYYASGAIKQMGMFLNNEPTGAWKTYNTSGVLISEGSFLEGKKTGKWIIYVSNTNKKYELFYEDGIRVDAVAFK
jgi:antitoxin component YwqK of YwqJK toxin-antitoxin module